MTGYETLFFQIEFYLYSHEANFNLIADLRARIGKGSTFNHLPFNRFF